MPIDFFKPSPNSISKMQISAKLTEDQSVDVGIDRYQILNSPVFFANELVDLVMVDSDHHPVLVHIFEQEAEEANLPNLLRDYMDVLKHLEKLKLMFSHVKWADASRLRLMLLAPKYSENFLKLCSLLQVDLVLVEYEAVYNQSIEGILLREKPRRVESRSGQRLDSLFSVLAENVKSDTHSAPGGMIAIERQSKTFQGATTALSFFERGKLSEEELVAFLDFEKKASSKTG